MAKVNMQNNYVKLGMILLLVILVTLITANIYSNSVKKQIENGRLTSHVLNIEYNEIHNVLVELSGDSFLYISYTGDREIYNLDARLNRVIQDNDLANQFIYLNMKEQMENDDYLIYLNSYLNLTTPKIRALPAIIYYRDNRLVEIIDSNNRLLRYTDFTQLLEKYEVTQND